MGAQTIYTLRTHCWIATMNLPEQLCLYINFLTKHNMMVVSHPTDLANCDSLFPNMKIQLSGEDLRLLHEFKLHQRQYWTA